MKDLIVEYDIDGLRIDTVPEVPKWFWKELTTSVDIFGIGDCFNRRVEYSSGYQGPIPSVMNYPLYYTIIDVYAYG